MPSELLRHHDVNSLIHASPLRLPSTSPCPLPPPSLSLPSLPSLLTEYHDLYELQRKRLEDQVGKEQDG